VQHNGYGDAGSVLVDDRERAAEVPCVQAGSDTHHHQQEACGHEPLPTEQAAVDGGTPGPD
jgi:hypothetical protein